MNIITFAPQPPPRHPPMTAAPTAATPTSTTRNWPEILPFHSSQELTKATWFLNITKKSHQAFLSPGKPPWATPTGPTMSQPSHSQLKQLAHKRKDSATKEERFEFNQKIEKMKKTEMCRNILMYQNCKYGDACSYAHNYDELVPKTHLPSNYKTKMCS